MGFDIKMKPLTLHSVNTFTQDLRGSESIVNQVFLTTVDTLALQFVITDAKAKKHFFLATF